MALDNFIPQLWAGSILRNLFGAHVYGQAGVVNRDYEGEIRQAGDTVNIARLGAVNIINYTKNTDLSALQVMSDATDQLLIDQQKAFNIFLDDIDEAQTKPKLRSEITREAGEALAAVADDFLAAEMTANVDAGNVVTAGTPDATTAYGILVEMGVILDEDNVPAGGRWIIAPSWFHGLLLQDDRFVGGQTAQNTRLENGIIGEAAGFTILKSNNVPSVVGPPNTYDILAGHAIATTFAEQIVKTEAVRNPSRFGDNLRGLHVYGAEVVRPTALAKYVATRA